MKLKGSINRVYFFNPTNGYTVASIILDEGEYKKIHQETRLIGNKITAVGNFDRNVFPEEEFIFEGNFVNNPTYGLQFQFDHFERVAMANEEGLVNYLSSELFPEVGIVTAKKIVKGLGINAIEVIEKNPNSLKGLGLSSKQIKTITEGIKANANTQAIMLHFMQNGITMDMCHKIVMNLGSNALEVVKNDPYVLMNTVSRFGFKKNDVYALRSGVPKDSPLRIKAVISYVLKDWIYNSGNSYLHQNDLYFHVKKYLNEEVDINNFNQLILELAHNGKVFIDRSNNIFDALLYQQEIKLAEYIASKMKNEGELIKAIDPIIVQKYFTKYLKSSKLSFDEYQRQAIMSAFAEPIIVVTGGPGTGKTTIIRAIIENYLRINEDNNTSVMNIALLAPTGRAAKRLKDLAGIQAQTIHRYLGYKGDDNFTYGEHNQTTEKLIIIDEASMVDLMLAYQLFSSIQKDARVVIVGDVDQLPAVGPGQVLKDIIDSKEVKTIRLHKIHRQASDSNIIKFAHELNEGILSKNIRNPLFDRVFHEIEEEEIVSQIVRIVKEKVSQGLDIVKDIQVLVPMYRGNAGINEINLILQDVINPLQKGEKDRLKYKGQNFRSGDKVIQLINRTDKNIMNGDIGIILNIAYDKQIPTSLSVVFDSGVIEYTIDELDDLSLAYAISVHKSQGSEFDTIIMPFSFNHRYMLKRKLIYTAVTRAKKHLIMLGNLNILYQGIKYIEKPRKTILSQKITEFIKGSELKIDDKQSAFSVLGEKSFGNLDPYDFE